MLRSAFYTVRLLMRHPVARARPLATLVRILRWQWRSRRAPGLIETAWVNGSTLVAGHGHGGASGNIYYGLHEFEDMAFFAHMLRPGDGFIDAGANIGAYSILVSAVSGAHIQAIEPASETIPVLRENFRVNDIHGRIHQVALGATDGTARFTVGRGGTNQFDADGRAEVTVKRLDSLELGAIAMKADLEGGEAAMLKGAPQTLRRLWAVELETVDDEARDLLEKAGFVEQRYDPATRAIEPGKSAQSFNALWVKSDRLEDVAARLKEGASVTYGSLVI